MFMPAYGMIRFLATPDGFAELRWTGGGLSRGFARRGLRWLAEKARHGRADLRRPSRQRAAARARG